MAAFLVLTLCAYLVDSYLRTEKEDWLDLIAWVICLVILPWANLAETLTELGREDSVPDSLPYMGRDSLEGEEDETD